MSPKCLSIPLGNILRGKDTQFGYGHKGNLCIILKLTYPNTSTNVKTLYLYQTFWRNFRNWLCTPYSEVYVLHSFKKLKSPFLKYEPQCPVRDIARQSSQTSIERYTSQLQSSRPLCSYITYKYKYEAIYFVISPTSWGKHTTKVLQYHIIFKAC